MQSIIKKSFKNSSLSILLLTLLYTPETFADEPLKKVSNGQNALAQQAPWQAAIFVDGFDEKDEYAIYHLCDAAIIDKSWIMTAAHCFDQDNKINQVLMDKDYYAIVGEANLSIDADTENRLQAIKTVRTIVHPNYDEHSSSLDNDIALLELEQPINLSACGSNCKVIAWATPNNAATLEQAGRTAQIAGWGITGYDELGEPISPRILQFAPVSIETCPRYANITSNMICAKGGTVVRPIDSCSGDSGSALVVNPNLASATIVGITSWDEEKSCGQYSNFPGVYTRVSQYDQWINSYLYPHRTTSATTSSSSGGGSMSGFSIGILMLLALGRFYRRK